MSLRSRVRRRSIIHRLPGPMSLVSSSTPSSGDTVMRSSAVTEAPITAWWLGGRLMSDLSVPHALLAVGIAGAAAVGSASVIRQGPDRGPTAEPRSIYLASTAPFRRTSVIRHRRRRPRNLNICPRKWVTAGRSNGAAWAVAAAQRRPDPFTGVAAPRVGRRIRQPVERPPGGTISPLRQYADLRTALPVSNTVFAAPAGMAL
jgi:hypothetical protein